jgi:tRNA threonylcarbamoyladenosine biosynthesis protein TsaB
MKILAFDSALTACSAAIIDQGNVLAERCEARARGHAEALMPMIEEVRRVAAVAYHELDLIAVTVGPGSFTGIRVGVAAARAIAIAAGKRAVGVTTLAAMAQRAVTAIDPPSRIVSIIDARRDEAYVQIFSVDDGYVIPASAAPELDTIANIVGRLGDQPATLVGSGATKVLDSFPESHCWLVTQITVPDSPSIARLACVHVQQAGQSTSPTPLYIRQPDTNRPRQRP